MKPPFRDYLKHWSLYSTRHASSIPFYHMALFTTILHCTHSTYVHIELYTHYEPASGPWQFFSAWARILMFWHTDPRTNTAKMVVTNFTWHSLVTVWTQQQAIMGAQWGLSKGKSHNVVSLCSAQMLLSLLSMLTPTSTDLLLLPSSFLTSFNWLPMGCPILS